MKNYISKPRKLLAALAMCVGLTNGSMAAPQLSAYPCDASFNDITKQIVLPANVPMHNLAVLAAQYDAYKSYTWDFGDGSKQDTGRVIRHNFPSSGKYLVTLKVFSPTQGNLDVVCEDKKSQWVIVGDTLAKPCDASFTSSPAIEDDFVNGVAYQRLWAFEAVNQKYTSYKWDFGDGSNGSGIQATHTYKASGKYTVTLTVLNSMGDEVKNCIDSKSQTVEVIVPNTLTCNAAFRPRILSTMNVPPSTSAIVGFDAVTQGYTSYEWDFGDGTTGKGARVDHSFKKEGTYLVTLHVTNVKDDKTCEDTQTMLVTKSFPAFPCLAKIGSAVNEKTVALWDSVVYQPIVPDGIYEVRTWYYGDGTQGDGQKTSHTYEKPGVYSVTLVKATYKNPCFNDPACKAAPILICEQKYSTTIAIQGDNGRCAAKIAFERNANTLTFWDNVAFNTLIADGTYEQHDWYFGDGQEAHDRKVTHTYTQSGTYQVTLVKSVYLNPCFGDPACYKVPVLICQEKYIDTIEVKVSDRCHAKIETYVNGSTVTFRDAVVYYPIVPDGTYEVRTWTFGDGTSGRGQKLDHTYPYAGTFNVTLLKEVYQYPCWPDTLCKAAHRLICSEKYNTQVIIKADSNAQLCNAQITHYANGLEVTLVDNYYTDTTLYPYTVYEHHVWDFGDGTKVLATGKKVSHTYAQKGNYVVTLTKTVTGTPCPKNAFCPQVIRTICSETHLYKLAVADPNSWYCDADVSYSTEKNTLSIEDKAVYMPFRYDGINVTRNWDFGDGSQATGNNLTHTYAAGGTYKVTLVKIATKDPCLPDSNGIACAGLPYLLCIDTTVTYVYIRPACEKPSLHVVTEGNKVTVSAAIPEFYQYSVIKFGEDDVIESTGARKIKATHKYSEAGDYKICLRIASVPDSALPYVKLAAYCSEELCIEVNVNDGKATIKGEVITSLYPSPAKETITIAVKNTSEELTLRLYDISGYLMKEVKGIQSGTQEINTQGLDNGLYFYTFSAGNSVIDKGKITVAK